MSEITPVTHTEKVVAGQVDAVTHFEKVIAKYGGGNVYESLEAGTNILIEETSDGKAKISASGEISSEDTVARADIAAIKDGETLDSFGDVETALGDKQNTISDLATIRSGAALGATAVQPETGKGLSTNDYTNAEKSKLADIEAQANKTTVDSSLSGTSENPVQNKVVKSALDNKADASTTYTKTEVDTALSGKQATLTTAQLAAVNSGIDSTKVAQIETNQNNISTVQTSLEVGQNDNGKVLTASYSGGTGTYSWVTPSGGGTSDYTDLTNKPQINSITLSGNKSLSDLGIAAATDIPTLVSGLNTTGTVKNGSSVTSATGYTASPIISGIPYYKDTTYESKSAASGGTDVSLCTTGEKYTWNNKSTLQLTNSTTPIVDGTAAIGTSTYAAKADHVHPTDTSRQAAITAQSPLSADVVSDTNTTNKFATQAQLDQISTNATNILSAYGGIIGKNVVKQNTVTFTGQNKEILCAPISGNITLYVGNCVSTDTDASTCALIIDYVDGGSSIIIPINRGTSTVVQNINLGSHVAKNISMYSSDNYAHGAGDTATFTDIMICSQANYIADSSYQPYVMSNAEITAWILSHT